MNTLQSPEHKTPAFHWLSGWLLCLVLLFAEPLCAQPVAVPPASASNRYLLIVDTSGLMDARSRNTLKTVQDLLNSDMNGQMKPGDTLGIWTFSAGLDAGRLPLQRWSTNEQQAITDRVITFLKRQKYEKSADMEKVLIAMKRVIKDSQPITVILVSAGDWPIHGTPFDDRINDFYQQWHGIQQKARMPFVIVLRARNGEITDYSLNRPPSPVQMPSLPGELKMAGAVQRKLPEAARPVQTPTAPPLIVSGKNAKPLHAPKSDKAPPAKPERPASVPTAEPAKIEQPKRAAPSVETAKAAPAPAAPEKPAVELAKVEQPKPAAPSVETAKAAPALAAPEKPAAEPAKVEQPKPIAPAVEIAKAALAPAAPEKPAAESAKIEQPKPAAPAVETAKAAPALAAPEKPATEPAKVEQPKPIAPAVETAKAVPAPAAPEKPAAEPKPVEPARIRAAIPVTPPAVKVEEIKVPDHKPAAIPPAPLAVAPAIPVPEIRTEPAAPPVPPREAATVPSVTLSPSAETAAAVSPGTFLSHKSVWSVGLVLAGVAIGFGLLTLSRSRATPHASLITRSLDREKRR